MGDLRQGVSATAHRVLDKAEALTASLAGRPETLAEEMRLEFDAVVEDVRAEALRPATLVRAAALFLIMAERMEPLQ